jgi:hypothetical protein
MPQGFSIRPARVEGAAAKRTPPAAGEVYLLYARPASWSSGQGRALLGAAVAALPEVRYRLD